MRYNAKDCFLNISINRDATLICMKARCTSSIIKPRIITVKILLKVLNVPYAGTETNHALSNKSVNSEVTVICF